MKILGIETSCDETAAAVIEDGKEILSNTIATSSYMHAQTGGIIPEKAAREQLVSVIPVIKEALDKAKCKEDDIDKIAVTSGPGLIGSLLVGVETAKTLSLVWNKPIIPVNHLAAHIYANWLSTLSPSFPALALVVSGGHTDVVLMKDHGVFEWVGGTRDDAAGEAFDKTARLLELPYPGGPSISKEADKYLKDNSESLNLFPRPMIDEENYDWSFSGLKTAVQNEIKENGKENVSKLAAEIQESIADVLVSKTIKAAKKYQPKSLLLAGGVAANGRLTQKFKEKIDFDIDLRVPSPELCTDNATYIAAHAFFNQKEVPWQEINANPNLEITGEA
jgi:N6-L-threonylcarbamoyladenine synthase